MNWKAKALLHWMLSYAPLGNEIHYVIQRNVTKTLPRPAYRVENGLMHARNHMKSFSRYADRDIEDASVYEFGAGADMFVQLLLYSFGINRQVTVDLNKLLKTELVNDSIRKIENMSPDSFRRTPEKLVGNDGVEDLRKFYGIAYRAPFDARSTGLADQSVDFIVSSETVQFIPRKDLEEILIECHRVLKKNAIVSLSINCDDIYAYVDPSISVYNFLQYSDSLWRLYNSPKHYQNRLRHLDYLRLFASTGFEVVEDDCAEVTKQEADALKKITLDAKFQDYPLEELAVRTAHFVLRKNT
ncbi:MAG TPA: methyltransferase domain-containing protein [Desulfomonilaceae bacterium]|nr:methyltransferase domain-containing protein [Desulfomonilaceae bacterium]